MKKLILSIFLLAFSVLPALAQDHILISEFVVTPTEGEFIEIYNPTDAQIDLTNYYISDATFAGGPTYYYQIVEGGGGGGGFGDFNARFPAGATIAAGEHQTIAILGDSLFFDTYGVLPTYELYEDGSDFANDVPNLEPATSGSIDNDHSANQNFGVLSNGGEVIVLYYWDGASDLVQDVDYVVWGDKNEAVDKTGVSIDGPDADSDPSTYANDTAIDDQTVVNTDNDDDENPHDSGMSAQRILDVEDLETWTGGNGMTGHDETSENTSWKGGIWSINEPATPGHRALTPYAPADSLTIADVNFVRAAEIGPEANDDSPYVGDTLSVTGVFLQGPREIFLGGRWGGFMQDERGGPWSGFFIIQNDTSSPGVEGTLLNSVQPGDKIRVTGVMSEFPTGEGQPSISQVALITDPVTPIEFIDFGLDLPDPIVLTPGDVGFIGGNSADPQLTERWESTLVRFEGLTVLANGLAGNTMTLGDDSGTIVLDDYFSDLSDLIDNNGGVWPGFPPGTVVNVTGILRGGTSSGFITINPRSLDDLEIASAPPEVQSISRDPVAPTSSDAVAITARLVSSTSTVASAELSYRVDSGAYQTVTMTASGDDYTGTIPAQADASFIEYFITASDAAGETTISPGDTSAARYFYTVRDGGLTIYDLQYTPFENGNSGYEDLEVTVSGIATTDSSDFSFYWIQDGTGPWTGIHVDDNVTNVKLGDHVTVTGTVREQFNETQIFTVTDVTINSQGNAVPEPELVNTGDITTGGDDAEAYEGVLVKIQDLTVTNPFSDGSSNFGEFTVDDGTGGLRVDDLAAGFNGNLDSSFVQDQAIESITGVHYFSFSNYKLVPRNSEDVVLTPNAVSDDFVPFTFALEQNYPNPFNPATNISYQVAEMSEVKIEIFNILGQKVRTLVNTVQPPGVYKLQWRGVNDAGVPVSSGVYLYKMRAGDFHKVQKMLFLK